MTITCLSAVQWLALFAVGAFLTVGGFFAGRAYEESLK